MTFLAVEVSDPEGFSSTETLCYSFYPGITAAASLQGGLAEHNASSVHSASAFLSKGFSEALKVPIPHMQLGNLRWFMSREVT